MVTGPPLEASVEVEEPPLEHAAAARTRAAAAVTPAIWRQPAHR